MTLSGWLGFYWQPSFNGRTKVRHVNQLRHIRGWISRKPLETDTWFQNTSNRKWPIWAIKWSRDRWRHVTSKGQTSDPNTLRAQSISRKLGMLTDIRINPDNKLSGYIRIINYPFNYPSTWRLIIFMNFWCSFSKFLRYFTKKLYINTSIQKY